jgi:hypothetical protein
LLEVEGVCWTMDILLEDLEENIIAIFDDFYNFFPNNKIVQFFAIKNLDFPFSLFGFFADSVPQLFLTQTGIVLCGTYSKGTSSVRLFVFASYCEAET